MRRTRLAFLAGGLLTLGAAMAAHEFKQPSSCQSNAPQAPAERSRSACCGIVEQVPTLAPPRPTLAPIAAPWVEQDRHGQVVYVTIEAEAQEPTTANP